MFKEKWLQVVSGLWILPGVVVGTRTKDVTQRVPGQTPDHPLMSHLHPSNLLLHPDTNNSKHVTQWGGQNNRKCIQSYSVSFYEHDLVDQPHARLSHPVCQKSRDPSEPPLANRPSWTGCQATAEGRKTSA